MHKYIYNRNKYKQMINYFLYFVKILQTFRIFHPLVELSVRESENKSNMKFLFIQQYVCYVILEINCCEQ